LKDLFALEEIDLFSGAASEGEEGEEGVGEAVINFHKFSKQVKYYTF
jgi:hypothetical protein